MNRVDALGPDRRRFDAVTGDVLGDTRDDALQLLVGEARRTTGAPIAGLSLVLQTIQYFRAADGLPGDLAHVRAVARDTAFCQYVVRDGAPFEVPDVGADPSVPDDLMQRYGIRSYLGCPVVLDDTVLGAMCIFDTRPRTFDDAARRELARLAERAEARLAVLAERGLESPQPIRAALQPAVAALHRRLRPLRPAVIEARVAALELEVLTHALLRADVSPGVIENLSPALSAVGALQSRLGRLEAVAEHALRGIEVLREVAAPTDCGLRLFELIDGADGISRPLTEPIGGVRWQLPPAECVIGMSRPLAIALLSTALTTLAGLIRRRTVDGDLTVEVSWGGDELVIEISSGRMRYSDGEMVASALGRLGIDSTPARLMLTGLTVQLVLPLTTAGYPA